jgi:hypothetical protein
MSTSVIILLMVGVVVALVLLVTARSGPRVTEITRTIRKDEDRDDA